MSMTRRALIAGTVLALTLVQSLGAFAQAPDLKSIAGKWTGTGKSTSGTHPLEWTIHEDGTVDVVAQLSTGPNVGGAKITVKDGGFFYESATSSGPVTVEGVGDARVMRYDETLKRTKAKRGAELRPAK